METKQVERLGDESFIRHMLYSSGGSALSRYKQLVVGDIGLLGLLRYEVLTTLFGPVPGALGLVLRRLFYRGLFKDVGPGVVIGKDVLVRHPHRIRVGKRVVIDDYCLIDARGAGEEGIVVGDETIVNRGTTIQAKVGGIQIGACTNIGAGSTIVAQGGVIIEEMVNIAGGCLISGGSYQTERNELSVREHGKYTQGVIRIGRKARLGMRVIVLDGVQIGEGSIVGAGSVVTHDLPMYSVATGMPARKVHSRGAPAQIQTEE